MKLLIVDDQRSVVQGLLHCTDWAALGFDQVEGALNAIDARASLQRRPFFRSLYSGCMLPAISCRLHRARPKQWRPDLNNISATQIPSETTYTRENTYIGGNNTIRTIKYPHSR